MISRHPSPRFLQILRLVLSVGILAVLVGWAPLFVGAMALVAGGMLLASVVGPWEDWLALAALLAGFVIFATLRAAMVPGPGTPVHFHYVVILETLGGLLPVPSVWLQRHLPFGLLEDLSSAIYASFFFVPQVVALFLWRRGGVLLRFVSAALFLWGVALMVHLLVPTAPPWLASQEGIIPPLQRMLTGILASASPGITEAGYGASANDVAAMPSVHQGMTVLAMIAMVRADPRTRATAWVYSLSMLFAITYLGEHYVVDALAGSLTAWLGWTVSRPLEAVERERHSLA